jgi:IstB-like ATP binding protein
MPRILSLPCGRCSSSSASPRRRGASVERLAQAETTQPAYSVFLHQILEAEDGARQERKLERRRRWSKLGPPVALDGFDCAACPQLAPRVIKKLLTCRFVEEHRNVIFVGKTIVATALGRAACARAPSVYYASMAQVLQTLHAARADAPHLESVPARDGTGSLGILDDGASRISVAMPPTSSLASSVPGIGRAQPSWFRISRSSSEPSFCHRPHRRSRSPIG